jgi:hypothetical protein
MEYPPFLLKGDGWLPVRDRLFMATGAFWNSFDNCPVPIGSNIRVLLQLEPYQRPSHAGVVFRQPSIDGLASRLQAETTGLGP